MNYRDILKLMQFIEGTGLGFALDAVEKVALMAGMRG